MGKQLIVLLTAGAGLVFIHAAFADLNLTGLYKQAGQAAQAARAAETLGLGSETVQWQTSIFPIW